MSPTSRWPTYAVCTQGGSENRSCRKSLWEGRQAGQQSLLGGWRGPYAVSKHSSMSLMAAEGQEGISGAAGIRAPWVRELWKAVASSKRQVLVLK